tara:strand:- start:1132 stop:1908 length:777 start_codon:yes stop_codon:yes gene_type:complete
MRHCITVVFLAQFFLVGCSTASKQVVQVSLNSETIDATADGISVVHISIQPNNSEVFDKLFQFGEVVGDQQLQENLKREGVQLLKIAVVDVPAIVASIGELENETYIWHGQIMKWRDLHQRAVDKNGMLISAEGIPYFIQRGKLSLLCRSWLMPQEGGLYMYLQAMPTWHVPRGDTSILSRSAEPIESKVFMNLQFETLLKDDEAILLAVDLRAPKEISGPQDDGSPPVRLGEALLGGPVDNDVVELLIIEANIMPRM